MMRTMSEPNGYWDSRTTAPVAEAASAPATAPLPSLKRYVDDGNMSIMNGRIQHNGHAAPPQTGGSYVQQRNGNMVYVVYDDMYGGGAPGAATGVPYRDQHNYHYAPPTTNVQQQHGRQQAHYVTGGGPPVTVWPDQQGGYQQMNRQTPQQSLATYNKVDLYDDQNQLVETVLTMIRDVRSKMSAKGKPKTRKRKTEYQCPHQACNNVFSSKQTLNEHLRVTHVEHIPGRGVNSGREKNSDNAATAASKKSAATTTQLKDKSGGGRDQEWFLCVYPSCGYQCRSRSALSRHFANKHATNRTAANT